MQHEHSTDVPDLQQAPALSAPGSTDGKLSAPSARTCIDQNALRRLRQELLPVGTKGLPLADLGDITIETIAQAGWNVLAGDVPLPLLTLNESALAGNIATMAKYCADSGVLLAPHGKTTMAPQLFELQINAGCWALSAATPTHLRLYRSFGVGRILYANELLERGVLHWLAHELNRDPAFDFYCLVDSPAGVARMASNLDGVSLREPINVLVEVGHHRGRTGCRTIDEVVSVAQAIGESRSLRLAGVEAFEGTMDEAVTSTDPARGPNSPSSGGVVQLLETVATAIRVLHGQGLLGPDRDVIVSAGGSNYFDLVVDAFRAFEPAMPLQIVLRSGSYIAHDGGYYEATSPLGRRALPGSPRLRDALELWSIVLSRPEPDLVILGTGKRDLPIDLGLPIPTRTWSEGRGFGRLAPQNTLACGVSDQHLHVRVDPQAAIDVGDLCACAISHPCTAFDKWSLIPIVDDDLTIIDAVRTFF